MAAKKNMEIQPNESITCIGQNRLITLYVRPRAGRHKELHAERKKTLWRNGFAGPAIQTHKT